MNINEITSSSLKSKNYTSIKEYLDKNLYPSLQKSINHLIEHIKTSKDQLEERLTKQFKIRFYQINNDYHKKQKELLKLERGDDYSETDYDYYLKGINEQNESRSENEENENDPDFEELNDEDLENIKQQLENEDVEKSFNPIMFLCNALRNISKERSENDVGNENESISKKDFLNDDGLDEIDNENQYSNNS